MVSCVVAPVDGAGRRHGIAVCDGDGGARGRPEVLRLPARVYHLDHNPGTCGKWSGPHSRAVDGPLRTEPAVVDGNGMDEALCGARVAAPGLERPPAATHLVLSRGAVRAGHPRGPRRRLAPRPRRSRI